jgi:hypothetical protein
MMKQFKTILSGIAVMVSVVVPLTEANAWVAAGGGYRGGFVAAGGFHPVYHPGYVSGGCYGCAAAAGAVVGMAVGAAVASSAQPVPVYVQQPTYVSQGNVPIGTQVATVPVGSNSMVVNGTNYYQYGATWYRPFFGSSGVYYQVVPAP